MAKLTFLQLVNRILKRISQTEITDTASVSGHASIVVDIVNDVQKELFNEDDWYSLYSVRTFSTSASTAEYAVASDFGKGINLVNVTSNIVMHGEFVPILDIADPDLDTTGTPEWFALQGSNYRFYPIPDGVYSIRERYWKFPALLSASTDVYDLPIECEGLLMYKSLADISAYDKAFDEADRYMIEYSRMLKKAKAVNKKKVDKILAFNRYNAVNIGLQPPQLPYSYGYPVCL